MRHVVLFALAGLTGCLAIRPGAPLPATTVGNGKVGLAFAGEGPMIYPIAKDQNANTGSATYRLGQDDSYVATSVSLAMGMTDDTDVELSLEGTSLLPLGGSLGVRHHVGASELFDFAIAAQLGGQFLGILQNNDGSAVYEAVEGVAQLRRGPVRPLLALELMPFEAADEDGDHIDGLASSLTFGVDLKYGIAQLEPYVTVSGVGTDSKLVVGGAFVTGGLMLAFRPDPDGQPLPSYVPPPG